MFGVMKGNLIIEKAIQISINEFGIDPMGVIGSRVGRQAQEWRDMQRSMVKEMSLNAHELAVLMIAAFASTLNRNSMAEDCKATVNEWENQGQIRAEIAAHFLNELQNDEYF